MARNQITGTFLKADGSLNANGYITLKLTQDCNISSVGQIGQWSKVTVFLNSSGTILGTVLIWLNDQLLPAGSQYIIRVYSSVGELISGPYNLTISSSLTLFIIS